MEDGYVLVIGSAGIDVKASPEADYQWGNPTLGSVRNAVGGVARNIAENLARLEVTTVLLTAVGMDGPGRRVLRVCEKAGIDCQQIRRVRGGHTSNTVTMLNSANEVQIAVRDIQIIEQTLTPAVIDASEALIADALMLVIDATLSEAALERVFALADKHDVRVAADPTAPNVAGRLCQYIDQLYLVTPNAHETHALCSISPASDRETALEAARTLVTLGAEIAVVTLGAQGLAYADAGGGGYLRAINTEVVDTTGAGDAFTGAVIFGLLNNVPVDEAMRLGITAASLTLQSSRTVLATLSQELLYSKLMA